MGNIANESVQYYLQHIYIRKILFDDSESVTIWGFEKGETIRDLIPCDYVCEFNTLTDLLLCSEIQGEKIIEALAETLSGEIEIPTIIDMKELFGTDAILIDNIVAEVTRVGEIDESGKWADPDDLCYYIESVRNTDEYFKKYKNELKTQEESLKHYFAVLSGSFKYYQQLLIRNFTEMEARKRAGLDNELLFGIAYLKNSTSNL